MTTALPERRVSATGLIPRSSLYLTGCLSFSFGATGFIYAELGTDPLDVLSQGLIGKISWMTSGVAHSGIAALCVAVWTIWNRKSIRNGSATLLPGLTSFLTFLLCGTLIDVFTGQKIRQGANLMGELGLGNWPTMFLGVVLCAYGSSLIIMSGFGIRAMDLLAISAYEKHRIPFWLGKGVLEVLLLAGGWLLGGPVGWGTVAFLIMVGWLIQPLVWVNRTFLSLPDYGLSRVATAEPF